jgi:hypothetical protein
VASLNQSYSRANIGSLGRFGLQIVSLIKRAPSTNIYKVSLLHLDHKVCVEVFQRLHRTSQSIKFEIKSKYCFSFTYTVINTNLRNKHNQLDAFFIFTHTLLRVKVSACFGITCPSSGDDTARTQVWRLLCAVVDVERHSLPTS